MPALGLNHYNLRADHALTEALCRFYVGVIGMHIGPRPPFNFPGYWLYLGDQAVLHLVEAPATEKRTPHISGTFDHVAFTCEGLAAFEAHLKQCGAVYRKANIPGSAICQLFLTDPAGNGVELHFASAQ
jgi:catechol-2,3-dioxygenase